MRLKKLMMILATVVTMAAPIAANADMSEITKMYVTADSGLNIRTEGNVDSEKLSAIPYGTEVEIQEIKDDWARIIYEEREAYMCAEWLSETKPEPKVVETKKKTSENVTSTYYGNCRITFYCNCSKCCGSWSGGPTASGAMPSTGRTVAMSGLPFGTKVSINGSVYTVEDRGVSGNAVDIYVGSHSEALNRGMYYADVYIVA